MVYVLVNSTYIVYVYFMARNLYTIHIKYTNTIAVFELFSLYIKSKCKMHLQPIEKSNTCLLLLMKEKKTKRKTKPNSLKRVKIYCLFYAHCIFIGFYRFRTYGIYEIHNFWRFISPLSILFMFIHAVQNE